MINSHFKWFFSSFINALFTLNVRWFVTALFGYQSQEILAGILLFNWTHVLVKINNKVLFGFWIRILKVIWLIQLIHKSYQTLWLIHYFSTDTSWDETCKRLENNIFCPLFLKDLYRNIIYEYDKEQLKLILSLHPWSKRLTKCYIDRQIRCGCIPIIEQV